MSSGGAMMAITAATMNASRASGSIITVAPGAFEQILSKSEHRLVVHSTPPFWSKKHSYLTSYKGLTFFTRSPQSLTIPEGCEIIEAKTIWIPEM